MKKPKKRIISLVVSLALMIVPTSIAANADSCTMVTDYIVTGSYLYKNGIPSGFTTHLTTEFNKVQQAYSNAAITILKKPFQTNTDHIKSTRAEQCPNYLNPYYDTPCECIDPPYYNCYQFHHTSIEYIRAHDIPDGSVNTNINIMLTANSLCRYGTDGNSTSPTHTDSNGYYGRCFTNHQSIIVKDVTMAQNKNGHTVYYDTVGSVIAHEIGHLYGLEHHTQNQPQYYSNVSHDCIMGQNKFKYHVINDVNNWFCDYCKLNLTLVRYSYNQSL